MRMKINSVSILYRTTPLKTPFVTSLRRVESAEAFIVAFHAGNLTGYGSASPTAAITGDTSGSIVCALRDYLIPRIIGKELSPELLDMLDGSLIHNTSPKAACDIALYDLLSQQARLPLYAYLGGSGAKTLESDITIALGTPEKMAHDTAAAIADGWNILKIKLGTGADDDIARLEAIAPLVSGSGVTIRLDANQGWSENDTIRVEAHCTKLGLSPELIEQPLKFYESSSKLAETLSIPLLADESVFSDRDAKRILETRQASMINIKLMKSGGISGALKICDTAREYGAKGCMLGCMLEDTVGIIAAAHLACARSEITMYDLDAAMLCEYVPCSSSTVFQGRFITPTESRKGLGIYNIGKASEICTISQTA